jgi:tetratricopeptide (TPR) repeat protein
MTEAGAALTAAAPLFPTNPDLALDRVQLAIRAGDFAQADRILMDRSALGNTTAQMNAAWWEVLSLRYQGRLTGAMTWARRYRRLFESVNGLKEPQHGGAIPQAQVLFESGRYRDAAALFDSIASTPSDFQTSWPGVAARHVSWNLTHAGTALSAAGDTLMLGLLADSIERTGRGSMYGRDGRLHNHLRGLLWEARGQSDSAAAAFERAIFSRTEGYTRTNLELAGALIRLHRPREAVEILRSALRGGLEASNYYVTQPELHALLAEAYEAAGEADSAAAQYAWVEHAWSSGDPGYRARAAGARERIAVLQRN